MCVLVIIHVDKKSPKAKGARNLFIYLSKRTLVNRLQFSVDGAALGNCVTGSRLAGMGKGSSSRAYLFYSRDIHITNIYGPMT